MYDIIPRKDSIILATIDVLDELGIQGLTINEIARKVGISEGAIYKHYKSKSALIGAVIDHFFMFDIEIRLTVEMKGMSPREAIFFAINTYASYYESYPAITALNEILNELTYDADLSDKVKSLYLGRIDFLKNLITKAQDNGEFNVGLNSTNLADVIMGLFKAICLRWRFLDQGFHLSDETSKTLNMVLDSFSK